MLRWFSISLVCLGSILAMNSRAGTLTASFNSIPAGSEVNLTTVGPADWVHWGLFTDTSIDRKANVSPQISNFTPVDAPTGYVYIYQYSGDYAGYSWSDGTPHMAVTNTTTGVWAYGLPAVGSGFRFQVTAGTNTQTLKIYVGAFAARGKLRVYLSDGSAPGYTNGTAINNTGNGPSGVFTVNFAANSPNQTLHVVWTLDQLRGGGGTGNVTLQSAALSAPGVNNLPFVALTNPLDRTSFSSTDTIVLNATAGDADGTVSAVEFYADTNKIGEAASAPYSVIWTNSQPGSYVLTARAIDNAGGVGISSPVTVFVSRPGGALSGTRSNSPAAVNLTMEGTSDWAHWGALAASSFDHKAAGNSQISNYKLIGSNVVTRYDNNYTAFSWSDGVPLAAASGSATGIYVTGVTNGFEISAPADTSTRTLKVYVGLYGAQANFEAFLSDFSGPAFTDTSLSNVFGERFVVYTINYAAASPGQRLIVRQTIRNVYDFTYGNVTLQAATLQGGAPPGGNVPPVITITNPANTEVFIAPATFVLEASASDSDGSVTQVEFFIGTTSLGTDTTSPYSAAVNGLSAGTYSLFAVATDNGGAKATNSITITVNSPPVNNPPSVTMTNPVDGMTFAAPATFVVQASASDSDGSVTQVEFFNGTTSIGADTTSPHEASVSDLAGGTYLLSAVATDNEGAKATNSITITVNALPTIVITSPTNNATFGASATFTITASATDTDGTVTNVAFYMGATWLGTDATDPFSLAVSNLAVGNYSFTAVATDNRGASTTSSPISITVVSNTPSAPIIFNPRIVGDDFVFSFDTRAATTYTVEVTDSLSTSNWQVVASFSGDGTSATITNRAFPAAQGFFRIGAQAVTNF